MELVCDPAVLFCDEVTSGLDSESALLCMEILSQLAVEDGKTVIVVIHQPSFKILKLVHHILVLRRGGVLGWNGPGFLASSPDNQHLQVARFRDSIPVAWRRPLREAPSAAIDFIEPGENVADFIVECVVAMPADEAGHSSQENTDELIRARREEALISLDQVTRTQLPSAFYQWLVFSGQSFMQMTRNYQKLALSMALVILAAIILGYTFQDDQYVGPPDESVSSQCPAWLSAACKLPRLDTIPEWASMISLALGLTSLATSVDVFLPEWSMLARQRRAGVNVFAYILARNIADGIPNTVIPPALFAAIFYYFKQPNLAFGQFYLVCMVTQFTCLGLGYMASLLAQPSPFLAGCVLVLISIAFSGVEPSLQKLNGMAVVGFLSKFSFARWTVESLYIQEVSTMSKIYDITPGLDALSYGRDATMPLVILFALGVAFRVVAALVYVVPYAVRKMDRVRRWLRRARHADEEERLEH